MRDIIVGELTQAAQEIFRGFAHLLPRLIVMLVIVFVGWVIAYVIRAILRSILLTSMPMLVLGSFRNRRPGS